MSSEETETPEERRQRVVEEATKEMYRIVSTLEHVDYELPYAEPMRATLRKVHDDLLSTIGKVQTLRH